MNGWLTPDLDQFSESHVERTISLPGSLWYLIGGCLDLLADAENWEYLGAATPEETADFFAAVVEEWAMSSFRNVGMIASFITSTLPPGWLMLTGQTIEQADYPELSDVVPSAWKIGSDIVLPDMEDSFLAHVGDTITLGSFTGANTHTLTVAQMPAHTHSYDRHNAISGVQGGATSLAQLGFSGVATTSAGSGSAHNNIPRNLGIVYAIYAGR
jgi:microcystin-dependent protein